MEYFWAPPLYPFDPIVAVIGRLTEAGVVAEGRADEFLWSCRGLITSAVMEYLYKNMKCKTGGKNNDLGPALARRLVGDLLWGFGVPGSTDRGSRS